MSHRSSHRPHAYDDSDDEEAHRRPAAASSAAASSAAAAAAADSAAAAAATTNPLSDLLRDVQCGICLSVAVRPVSLPCNHFYCEFCMQQQLREEGEREQSKRKAKSNATIRQRLLCPTCRSEYTRRNIVEDPLIRCMADLALQLRRQPDVRELVGVEESIFDLSQQTAPSPPRPVPTRSASAARHDQAATPVTPAAYGRRTATSKATTPSSAAAAAGAAASSGLDALIPPVIHDPFAFHASDTQHSSGSDGPDTRATAAASRSIGSSALVTPLRQGRGGRKNYREVSQSSLESSGASDSGQSSDDADDEDDGSDGDAYPRTAASTPAHRSSHSHSHSNSPSTGARDGSSAVKSKKCKGYPETELPADACMVCCAVSEEEAVVTCKLCKVRVHSQLCYGSTVHEISEAERANWHCDRCSESMGTKMVTCCVCPNTDDQAFKKTDQGTWIHASCAQWIPECRFRFPAERREVVEHTKSIPANRWSVPCRFCTGKGAILQCTFPRCRFGYHVPCGLRRGICFELVQADGASQLMSQDEGSSDIFYHTYCRQHVAQRHLVPACNSKFAVSAKKKKRGDKRRRADKDSSAAAAAAAGANDSGSSDGEPASHKRARGDSSRLNRSINLAETSLDTTMNDSSAQTPVRTGTTTRGAFSIASLLTPASSSPLVAHTPHAGQTVPAAAAAAASTAAATSHPAIRKLDFPTPSLAHNVTTSVGVVTRSSPLKNAAPPLVRSASAGQLASHAAAAASPSKPALTRPSSLRGHAPSATTAAAPATITAPPAASAAAATSRTPLRSMGRAEVNSRDAAAAAPVVVKTEPSSGSVAAAGSSRSSRAGREAAKRHHIVMMGTRLDSEQQALLDELSTLLNSMAKERENKQDRSAAVPYTGPVVTVQSSWDDRVTHVITAASDANGFVLPSRTIKYFQGLLSSAWVVGIDWVAASICARKLVPEGEYLVQGDAKLNGGELTFGAKRARNRERLFAHTHFVLNMPFKQPLRADVEQLIAMGGGEVREEIPAVKKRGGRAAAAAAAHKDGSASSERHHSDIDDCSQTDDTHASPAATAKRAGAAAAAASSSAAGAGAPVVVERGKWFLLCDDTATKGATTRAHLKQLVSPALWAMCERQQIPVVGVNWMFDSISAFKLRPLPA